MNHWWRNCSKTQTQNSMEFNRYLPIDLMNLVFLFSNYVDVLDDFIQDMLVIENEPSYGVFKYDDKVIFISFVPERSRVKLKMQYASLKWYVQESLNSVTRIHRKMGYSDGELDKENLLSSINEWRKTEKT